MVLGILVALQINDWNEERKNAQEEQQLLTLIHEALDDYIWLLEQGSKRQEDVVAACERLIRAMKTPSIPSDTENLDRDLTTIISSRWMIGATATSNIYDALIDGGKFGLISSQKLQTSLRGLKQQFSLAFVYEELRASFVDSQLSPFLSQHIDRIALSKGELEIDSSLYNSPFSTDYETLLESREFSNYLAELIKRTEVTYDIYLRLYNFVHGIDALVIQGNPSLEPKTFNREDLLNEDVLRKDLPE